MLHVAAEAAREQRASDSLDVLVDQEGELVVFALDFQRPWLDSDPFASSLLAEARGSLERHAPLHSVVSALEMQLAARPGVEVGLLVIRVSQRDAKVELLNAGMPPVSCAAPGGRVTWHPALSHALGARVGDVHPYELVPLAWGSTWLAASDRALEHSLGQESVRQLCAKLGLTGSATQPSGASAAERSEALQALLMSAQERRDDATLILISADAEIRFKPA